MRAPSSKNRLRASARAESRVVEVGSNDGYLLQYFVERGIPCLGVDPAANCAKAAWELRRVPTEVAFFGSATATRLRERGGDADLIVANNVLAHVPDINDFVAGFKILLSERGVATFEFPHVLEMIRTTNSIPSITSTIPISPCWLLSRCSRGMGCASSMSNDCRRTADRCGSMSERQDGRRAKRRCSRSEARGIGRRSR